MRGRKAKHSLKQLKKRLNVASRFDGQSWIGLNAFVMEAEASIKYLWKRGRPVFTKIWNGLKNWNLGRKSVENRVKKLEKKRQKERKIARDFSFFLPFFSSFFTLFFRSLSSESSIKAYFYPIFFLVFVEWKLDKGLFSTQFFFWLLSSESSIKALFFYQKILWLPQESQFFFVFKEFFLNEEIHWLNVFVWIKLIHL